MVTIILLSTFICIAGAVMAVYWLLFRPVSATAQRLSELDEGRVGSYGSEYRGQRDGDARCTFGRTDQQARAAVRGGCKKTATRVDAGGVSLAFRTWHLSCDAVVLDALLSDANPVGLDTVLVRPLNDALLPALFAFGAGFILPRFILNRLIANRKLRITWGLADALDLMVITMEAGLGLNAAMLRVCEELRPVHPDISKEFELANLEIRVGRERSEALRNLADRTGVEDLNSLVGMLIQADRFGTSIARAVRVYSDSLRTKRRQRAEQAAQKAAFKLLLPLGALLFPTMFIIILGPALLNISDMLGGGGVTF